MEPLQVALVSLLVVWTLMLVGMGFGAWIIFKELREGVNTVRSMLSLLSSTATNVRTPVDGVIASVKDIFAPGPPIRQDGPACPV